MAEGGGLLNRYTLQRRIQGSNPCVSANYHNNYLNYLVIIVNCKPLGPRLRVECASDF